MPIDPSIPLGVKPVQLTNPLERYMQVQQLDQMQNQSRLADLMYGEKQQQVARAQGLRDLAKTWNAGTTDEQVRDSMRNNGYIEEADKYETMLQNRAKTKAETGKADAEAQAKQFDMLTKANGMIGSAAGAIMQNPTHDSAVQLVNGLRQQFGPELSTRLGLDTLEIPRDPAQLKAWAKDHYTASIDTEKQLADARAAFEGAANRKSQQQIAAGHDAVTRRGQDLADTRAREQLEAGRNQVVQSDNGPVLVNTRTGAGKTITAPDGQPLPGVTKPLNDSQSKALLFGTRMQESHKILNQLATEGTTTSVPGAHAPFIGGVISALSSDNRQMLDQAKRDFINATLRRESGAAISTGEFDNGERQYFPQYGDGEAVIAQKARNRELAIRGVLAEVPEKQRGSITPPTVPKKISPTNAKGWKLYQDANGNKAYVSPDGKSHEEVR